MLFITETSSYSVAKFYDLFQHKLPLVVMVTQGFHGDIIEDTFDREQVMVLCAISRQSRVVGIFTIGGQAKRMSIPEEYTEKLCAIKRGEGEVSREVIHMPLYLSELRLSIVTGIIGLSFERWRLYVDHIKRECLSIEYDMYFGNPNIAEYDPYAIHSDTKISYVQPKSYSSIISLVQGQPLKQRPSLQVPTQQNTAEQNYRQPRPLPPIPTEPKQPLHNKAAGTCHSTQTSASMYITPISPSKSDLVVNAIPAIPCRASPVPDYYQEETNGSEARPSVEERRQFATRHRQVIPERQPISSHQTVARQHDMKNPKYTNDLPISSVSPTIQTQHQHSREKLNATPSDQVNIINDSSRKSKEVINVEKLSINEVCEYLKVLKLDQYSETFRNDMIDGAILVGLTGSMLKDDFRMRGVEALRLLKFAKEGYIPA